MDHAETRWPPRVGDHVQIVSTGASGVVMEGGDVGHFRVAIYSHEMRSVTTAPYRTFALRELGPESAPPPVVPPGRAAPRGRAGQVLPGR
jgi:hypothetical protein